MVLGNCAGGRAPVPGGRLRRERRRATGTSGPERRRRSGSQLPPAASQPTTAPDRGPDRWDAILAAGQREGIVVLAGPAAAAVREGLKAFTDQYKIQVDYLAGQEGQHYARIEPEFSAGKLTVDLYIGGPNVPVLRMAPNGMLEPLKPTLIRPEVGCGNWTTTDGCPWFLDPEGQYVLKLGNQLAGMVWVNSRNLDPASLNTADELLAPRYKRRIGAHDPAPPGGSGTAMARRLIQVKGEDFVRQLYRDQEITLTANTTQVAEWVARGTYDVVLGASPSAIGPLYERGLPVQPVILKDVPPYLTGGFLGAMVRLKNPPHPNAATVLTNWLLSKEGAEMLGHALDFSITRSDSSNDWVGPWLVPQPGVEYADGASWEFLTKTGPEIDVIRERLFRN